MWFSVFLGSYHHPVAPRDRFPHQYWFDDAKGHVLVETCFHLVLPVEGDGYRCVMGHWFCIRIYHEPHRDTVHEWKWLVLAGVEGAGFVVIQEPLLKGSSVVLSCGERQRCGFRRWVLSWRAVAGWMWVLIRPRSVADGVCGCLVVVDLTHRQETLRNHA